MRKLVLALIASGMILLSTGCSLHEHEWADATCETPKTCTVCGETEGDTIAHDWVDADCENPKTCALCGATEGEPLGHKWKNADCTNPKTCTVCGATEGKALGHKWIDATYTSPKTCSVCGKTSGKKLEPEKRDRYFNTETYGALYVIKPNSAYGLRALWFDKYLGEKEIKYYTMNFSMINAVGDPAYDQITGEPGFTVRAVGPVKTNEYLTFISDDHPEAYCTALDKLQLDTIELEFVDGTTTVINYYWCNTVWDVDDMSYPFLNAQKNYPDFYNSIG